MLGSFILFVEYFFRRLVNVNMVVMIKQLKWECVIWGRVDCEEIVGV